MSSLPAPAAVADADTLRALQRLQEAHSAIVAAPDDAVLDETCRQVTALLGSEFAAVATRVGDTVVVKAVAGHPVAGVGDVMPVAGTISGLVLLTGKPVLCTDVRTDPRTDVRLSRERDVLSSVTAPLRLGGEVIGLLKASSPSPGRFDEVHLRLLSMLGDLAAARLERVLAVRGQAAATQALRERELLMETVFASLDEGVLLLDREGVVVLANAAANALLHVPQGWMTGQQLFGDWGGLLGDDGRPMEAGTGPIRVALAAGATQRHRVLGLDSGGRVRWLQVNVVPLAASPAPNATPESRPAVVVTFTDVTAARERAQAVEVSRRRLEAAGELTGLAWWEHDLRADTYTWSSQMYALVGRDPASPAPTAQQWGELVHPDDRAALAAMVHRELGETEPRSLVLRALGPEGDYRVVKMWHSLQVLPGEEVASRSFGTLLDVTAQVALGRALSDSEHRLADAQGLLQVGFWQWDLDTGDLDWSEGMYRLVGIASGSVMTADRWRKLKHSEDRHSCDNLEQLAVTEGIGFHHVFRIIRTDGETRFLQAWTDATRDDEGRIVGLHGATLDVTERELAAREVEARERQLRAAFDEAPIGMAMTDLRPGRTGTLLRVNAALAEMLGRSRDELLAGSALVVRDPRDVGERLSGLVTGEPAHAFEQRFQHPDGRWVHAWVTESTVLDDAAEPLYLISHVLDVTARHEQEAELSRMALTDGLTGLANRTLLDDRLRHAIDQLPRRPGAVVGLLLLDVDRFKLVNDSLGHQVGDALLVEVARRLTSVCRRGSTVARQGGDEFVVLIDQARSPHEVRQVAARVVETMRLPYELPTGDVVVSTVSVGIAVASEAGVTPDDLVREADLALYHAKDTGRDRVAVFDSALRARALARVGVESVLRRALDEGGLRMYLQPVVELATSEVTGAEALVRLLDADGSIVMPADFIEVAEDSGLVSRVDTWVMQEAVTWLATHPAGTGRVAVNVSGRTLEQPGFVLQLERALRDHAVAPGRLSVELTESVLMFGNPAVKESIRAVSDLGVAVGIDDFGTGYSALAYLQAFELDFLKIDRSFVSRLGTEPRAEVVVTAIVDLAHAHGMTVIAEGVESQAQAQVLTTLGCDAGQGWLFGRPAPSG